jgi:hypothetical protein
MAPCAIQPVVAGRAGAFARGVLQRLREDPRVRLDGEARHVVVISTDPFAAPDLALSAGRSILVHAIGGRASERSFGRGPAAATAAGRDAAAAWLTRAANLLAQGGEA